MELFNKRKKRGSRSSTSSAGWGADLPRGSTNHTKAILIGLFTSFWGVIFGYESGAINGLISVPYWLENFATHRDPVTGAKGITSIQQSLIISSLSIGTIVGALIVPLPADRFGRKWALVMSSIIFAIGVALQTASSELKLFLVSRVVAGVGVGLVSALTPMYQAETMPRHLRGLVVTVYQLCITFGIFLSALVVNFTESRPDSASYRIPVGLQLVWTLILGIGMCFQPESPRWYILKGRDQDAALSLSRLKGGLRLDHPEITSELDDFRRARDIESHLSGTSYASCFRGSVGSRVLAGAGLQALQQLTGINFIFYYGTTFFKQSEISSPYLISLITSLVNFLSTIPALYLICTQGRRRSLLFGALGMCVCAFVVAIVGDSAKGSTVVANKVLICWVCFYIFFFASSWGPVPWVFTAEIFPGGVRAKAMSITTATNWLLNWGIGFATPYMVNSGGGSLGLGAKVFYIWAGCCGLCIVFVYFMVHETEALSLEDIDRLYLAVNRAWRSRAYIATGKLWQNAAFSGANEQVRPGSVMSGGSGGGIVVRQSFEMVRSSRMSKGSDERREFNFRPDV